MPKQLSPWAIEGKRHLQKYRPKMASQLEQAGKLDDWAQNAANRAVEESGQSIENGMSPLEAQSEAKRNHLFLPSEEDQPHLGENFPSSPDPASLVTTTGSPKPTTSGKVPFKKSIGLMADPEVVQHALARAKNLLAPSPERLKKLPPASKRIH